MLLLALLSFDPEVHYTNLSALKGFQCIPGKGALVIAMVRI